MYSYLVRRGRIRIFSSLKYRFIKLWWLWSQKNKATLYRYVVECKIRFASVNRELRNYRCRRTQRPALCFPRPHLQDDFTITSMCSTWQFVKCLRQTINTRAKYFAKGLSLIFYIPAEHYPYFENPTRKNSLCQWYLIKKKTSCIVKMHCFQRAKNTQQQKTICLQSLII